MMEWSIGFIVCEVIFVCFSFLFFWAYNKLWWCLSCLALSQQREYSLLTHEKSLFSFSVPWLCFCCFPLPLHILLSAPTSTLFDIIFKFFFQYEQPHIQKCTPWNNKVKNLFAYTGKRAIMVGVLHPFLLLTFLLGKQTKKIDHLHLFWVSLFYLLVFQE